MASLLTAALLAAAVGPTATLRSGPIEVPSPFVRLEQVAEIEGGDRRLRSLVLLTLEEAGYVTRDLVRLRLDAAGLEAEVKGPAYVLVRFAGAGGEWGAAPGSKRPPEGGDERSVAAILEAAARRGLSTDTPGIVLRLDGANAWGDDGPVDAGSLRQLRVEATGGGGDVRWVRFRARDGEGRRVHGWARFLVQERHRAVAAVVPIRRGELITRDRVELREIVMPAGRFDGFKAVDFAAGRHAMRDIREGSILRPSDVKRRLVVRKGAALTAEISGPGFRLSDRVVALQDGEEGEVIRVKHVRSGEAYRARVVSAQTVAPVN